MKKLIIEQCDSHEGNPRDCMSNIGVIAYKHSRYILGEEKIEDPIDFLLNLYGIAATNIPYTNETLEKLMSKASKYGYVLLPVYLFDHSEISISTSPFSCSWDSGQVGFIYTNLQRINDCFSYNWKRISKKRQQQIKQWLEAEIATFDMYIRGEVYGFIVEEDGKEIDSCWGFYGDDPRANGMQDYIEDELIQQYVKQNNL